MGRAHALQQSGRLFHYFVGEGRGVGAASSWRTLHRFGFICGNIPIPETAKYACGGNSA
jgi:hypothetical protein